MFILDTDVRSRLNGTIPIRGAATVAENISSEATIGISGFGSVGYPKLVPEALAATDRDLSITIISGGAVGEEIDTDLVEADIMARRYPYQAQAESRQAINNGSLAFQDRHISMLGDDVAFRRFSLDVAIVEAIAVGDGWFIPSTSIGPTPAYVEQADQLIIEVNRSQPLSLQRIHDVYQPDAPPNREPLPLTEASGTIGSPRVSFDEEKLEAVVESNRKDRPYSFRTPGTAERDIAKNLVTFLNAEAQKNPLLQDTVHLQFGVGSIGNALMSVIERIDFDDREIVYFGEVIQDGLLDMLDNNELSAASATSLALSEEGQTRLFDNIDSYAEDIVLRPCNISNSGSLINRFGVVGVNSALEVDIYGNVNSTHINGTHLVNGIGGSGDFSRNCLLSIIALPSTTSGGDISRVVPMVPHVDHTEHDIDVIVTEQGVADLRWLSPKERAETIVEHCAHPEYKAELRRYLDRATSQGGHIPHDLDLAFSWSADTSK